MSCNCDSSSSPSQVFTLQYQYNPACSNPPSSGTTAISILYTGVPLACSGVNTNDTLETALQKMDTIICAAAGDYSTYNTNCLTGPFTTEADFVDAITSFVCSTDATLTSFVTSTFPAYQTTVTDAIAATQQPSIICDSASVTEDDDLGNVLEKYCTTFDNIAAALDLSAVVWNNCFTVDTPPTSIADGFTVVLGQICSIQSSGGGSGTLPTFNNSGACLNITGTADSLVNTVNSIRTRVCQSPTFDINALTWGCIAKPSTTTTNLQSAFQSVLTKIDGLSQNFPSFSGDFVVTNVDDATPCLGKHIALAVPLNADRFVASNASDASPSTLVDKLAAGTNITLDDLTIPGKIVINSSGGDDSGELFADSTDDTLGFLSDKMEGFAGDFITITTSYDATNKKVKVSAAIDQAGLILSLMDIITNDPDTKAIFCALVSSCPSPCQPPQNVQALVITPTTTTTTTAGV